MRFLASKKIILISLSLTLCIVSNPAVSEKLKSRGFAKYKDTMGVVLVAVNWGRRWGCGEYDNAQLVNLKFELVSSAEEHPDDKYSVIVLKGPSRLFVNSEYLNYGFIVRPGDYALTEFSIKVAKSFGEVGYIRAGKSDLVAGSVYRGGILRVGAGDVIYVGHFYLDCSQTPIPWRNYADGNDGFNSYLAEIRNKFKFLKDVDIINRLFSTIIFGVDQNFQSGLQNEVAGDYVAARDSFERALDFARSSDATPGYVSALLYNLGRMYGYSCDFKAAERYLVDALERERALEKPDIDNITKRLSELARLSFDLDKIEQSANYYSEAIPLVEQLGIHEVDPIGYAYFLEGYSKVLSRLGRTEAASNELGRATVLRSENEGSSAEFIPIEYHDVCVTEAPPK